MVSFIHRKEFQRAQDDIQDRVTKVEFQNLQDFVDDGTFKADEAVEQFEEIDYKIDEIKEQM